MVVGTTAGAVLENPGSLAPAETQDMSLHEEGLLGVSRKLRLCHQKQSRFGVGVPALLLSAVSH